MKYYGKAEDVAAKIVDAFKTGDIPKAMATIFIRRKDGVPCRIRLSIAGRIATLVTVRYRSTKQEREHV